MAIKTIEELRAQANIIKNENVEEANTALRVGNSLLDIVDTLEHEDSNYLPLTGGNISGSLNVQGYITKDGEPVALLSDIPSVANFVVAGYGGRQSNPQVLRILNGENQSEQASLLQLSNDILAYAIEGVFLNNEGGSGIALLNGMGIGMSSPEQIYMMCDTDIYFNTWYGHAYYNDSEILNMDAGDARYIRSGNNNTVDWIGFQNNIAFVRNVSDEGYFSYIAFNESEAYFILNKGDYSNNRAAIILSDSGINLTTPGTVNYNGMEIATVNQLQELEQRIIALENAA